MNKLIALAMSGICIVGCGAQDGEEALDSTEAEAASLAEADEDPAGELGVLEQAIGEAACAAEPAAVTITTNPPSTATRKDAPPYGTPNCPNGFIVGFRTPNKPNPGRAFGIAGFGGSFNAAQCPNLRVTAFLYKNGVQVGPSKTKLGGTAVGGSCTEPFVSFSEAEVGAVPAAANARIVVKAEENGVLRTASVRIDGQG